MRTTAWTLVALLTLAPAALAQDAPPPAPPPAAPPAAPAPEKAAVEKHVNKITEAAKEAWEKMEKLMSSPIAQGLKDFQGTIEMKMELGEGMQDMPGLGMSFSVDFKVPRIIKVGAKGGEMFGPQTEGIREGVQSIVLNAIGLYAPSGEDEYDADLVTEDGKKVMLLTYYKKGVANNTIRMTLAENGLPSFGTFVAKEGGMEQKGKFTWSFAKDGDLHRLEKMTIEVPMMPAPIEYRVSYADAGGFQMPVKFVMDTGMMGKFGYRFTDLTVNGKKVDLAGAAAPAAPPTDDGTKKAGDGAKDPGMGEEGKK